MPSLLAADHPSPFEQLSTPTQAGTRSRQQQKTRWGRRGHNPVDNNISSSLRNAITPTLKSPHPMIEPSYSGGASKLGDPYNPASPLLEKPMERAFSLHQRQTKRKQKRPAYLFFFWLLILVQQEGEFANIHVFVTGAPPFLDWPYLFLSVGDTS